MSDTDAQAMPAVLSVTAAASLAGVARSTIQRAAASGRLSREPGGGVQVVELERVFGPLAVPDQGMPRRVPHAAPQGAANAAGRGTPRGSRAAPLRGTPDEVSDERWLHELAAQQAATIECLRADLREADERAERREASWSRQLDRLTALLPAPEPLKRRRGVLALLFGS